MATTKIWTIGEILTAADQNKYPVQHEWITKASDEPTTATSVQDDDHLVLPVAANTTYQLETELIISSPAAAAPIKLKFTAPAGATLDWCTHAATPAGTTNNDTVRFTLADTATPGNPGAFDWICSIRGVLVTSGTAGNFRLQFASSSGANAVTIRARSLLRLIRLVP